MSDKAFTLSGFQQLLGDTIRRNPFLQQAWVTAELSDVRVAGGHCYMELIEKDEQTGQVLAKMRAMIWSNSYRILQSRFLAATGMGIQSGMKVMVCGSATHHNVYGLSFSINDIDPSYTLGDIERQRREILERLQKEGILNKNREIAFPDAPQKIAVISAAGAAGYGDFRDHLQNSPERFIFYPLLVEAVMQGDRTAASVISALDFVESTLDFWDCVVIIRGGGSTTDLHGFDNYELARRVADFPLPVVVGIGHERDRNVLDEIACRRCKTPTAVADYLVECCRRTWNTVCSDVKAIGEYATDRLHGENLRLNNIENLLPARVNQAILREERRLDAVVSVIDRASEKKLSFQENRLAMTRMRLMNVMQGVMERPMMRLHSIEDMLRVLSPENTLKRGYSITRINGKALYDSDKLNPGDRIETTLSNGKIISEVIEQC
ncbi:MAG: exodeoxyribonuclease VII large subunit [Muribaculaceae bacterium]|nr:exodeoxyribonuclease VII large subunit [Muribaculaceae bacterium]